VISDLGKYWHTLRHLRPIQVYGRARLRFPRKSANLRPAPPVRNATGVWVEPAHRGPSVVGPSTLRFLNESANLGDDGWDDQNVSKLWRYNLHYFDDLNAVDARSRVRWHKALLQRWVAENPPGKGTGWEPYPTSLRIVNWIKWSLAGNQLPVECVQSLAVQTRWLADRLEIHLLGNHLFANAKALVFAGSFFEGDESGGWLERGLKLLDREIREQILPDGGHFERSPMYHALALEDILDLCNVAAAFSGKVSRVAQPREEWRAHVGPMRHWLVAMCHPDGEISFFNDAAFGIAASPREVDQYGVRLGFGGTPVLAETEQLPDSGYIRLEAGPAVAILDVGLVGPDYLPAHAHADTLSFELSLFGARVLVNSGTSVYETGEERDQQRGTAAHNTVTIDGADSSEVWGGFRVARRARPADLSIEFRERIVRCSHDGFDRLPGSPRHTRTWELTSRALRVEDRVFGKFHQAEARFHLHPSVVADAALVGDRPDAVSLRLAAGKHVRMDFDGGKVKYQKTSWHREFGLAEPNTCLVVEFDGPVLTTHISWGD